jgi:enamine deaminase RidA (YjgF/YER057c/UK114 family)
MGHTYITSGDGVPQGNYPFSAAVVAGNLCFISGQPALDRETGEYVAATIEDEFRQVPARLTYQAGALPLGCKIEIQAIAAHA